MLMVARSSCCTGKITSLQIIFSFSQCFSNLEYVNSMPSIKSYIVIKFANATSTRMCGLRYPLPSYLHVVSTFTYVLDNCGRGPIMWSSSIQSGGCGMVRYTKRSFKFHTVCRFVVSFGQSE